MIRYLPSYIMAEWNTCVFDSKQPNFHYLPLWEHFARKATAWNRYKLESINDTSGINSSTLQGFSTRKQVHKALARVFSHAGANTFTGRFLRDCDIKCWADLDKPILLQGWDRDVPFEVDVFERRMRSPGPNDCHPDAVFGQDASIQFNADYLRWEFHVEYGYSHDSSSWWVSLDQKPRESLYHFGQRIPGFIESLFEPEDHWATQDRTYENRQYSETHRAVDGLFYADWCGWRKEMARAVMKLPRVAGMANRRIVMTKDRFRTVQRWIKNQKARKR